MSWVIHHPVQYVGSPPKGNKQCAGLPIALNPSIPNVAHWKRGVRVQANTGLYPGTVIAIFNTNSDYQGSHFAKTKDPLTNQSFGTFHTALYVAQTALGIVVVHQNQEKHHITRSFIFFGGGGPDTERNKSKIRIDESGHYYLGKTPSGMELRWRDGSGDPLFHWGVSSTLKKVEDDARNYYVVELKPHAPKSSDFEIETSIFSKHS